MLSKCRELDGSKSYEFTVSQSSSTLQISSPLTTPRARTRRSNVRKAVKSSNFPIPECEKNQEPIPHRTDR